MLFREIVAIYNENRAKYKLIVWPKLTDLLIVKAVGDTVTTVV